MGQCNEACLCLEPLFKGRLANTLLTTLDLHVAQRKMERVEYLQEALYLASAFVAP